MPFSFDHSFLFIRNPENIFNNGAWVWAASSHRILHRFSQRKWIQLAIFWINKIANWIFNANIQREHIHRTRASSSHVAKWKNKIQFHNSDAQHVNGKFCIDCGFFCEMFSSRVNLLQFVRPTVSILRRYFFMSNSFKTHHHLNIVLMLQMYVWTWMCSFSSSMSSMCRDHLLVASIPVSDKLKLRIELCMMSIEQFPTSGSTARQFTDE